jgi:uncharacterized damage-inducible protein DinB
LSVVWRGVMLGSGIPRRETEMKLRASLFVGAVTVIWMAGQAAAAQQAAPATSAPPAGGAAALPDMTPVANPVSGYVKAGVARYGKNMVAAAEAMPAEKYSFKPSPEMNSFGHLVMHIAQSNNGLCSKISGMAAPEAKIADGDGKDKLVAALKASFDYCATALEKVDDSQLGDQMMLFGNRPFSRAAVLIILSDDWFDHYGAQATYLRLNGILPPSARPAPK